MLARTLPIKKRLSSAIRRSWPVPAWVMVKTRRRVRMSHRRRHWKRSRIKT